ncbi:MAG: alpha/beta fold hydrolase [Paracoccaceae bacterium]|nr:alpha/beta fold hydrolase [Paracoccaceae bacterium]
MKEPLVLIPGMMCDGRLFSPQLAAFTAERPVMVVPPVGDTSVSGLAQRCLRYAPHRFALAGLSMGGIVAMEVIRQAPGRVTRLALMDTNPLPDSPERKAMRDALITKVRNGELRGVLRDDLKPHYLAGTPASTRRILDLCMAMAEALGPAVFIDQSTALRDRPDQRVKLRSVSVPTLVLCGEDDRLCPPEHHRLMRDLIPDSQLVIVPGAGHLPTLENAKGTNEAFGQWLGR